MVTAESSGDRGGYVFDRQRHAHIVGSVPLADNEAVCSRLKDEGVIGDASGSRSARQRRILRTLQDLRPQPETEFYLGLVHMTDGVAGTQSRIAAARSIVTDFGVATQCGFGRRPAETISPLLEIHANVSDPW